LGDGIYFWEDGLRRAREWARDFVKGPASIVRAEIDLGRCLDLADTEYLDLLRQTYFEVERRYRENYWKLPQNREIGRRKKTLLWLDKINSWMYRKFAKVEFTRRTDKKLRFLDSLIINEFVERTKLALDFQTIRYPFEEGEPVFPGAMIRAQSHVQISVRDVTCIQSVLLVGESP
jgi:hypothetical protein